MTLALSKNSSEPHHSMFTLILCVSSPFSLSERDHNRRADGWSEMIHPFRESTAAILVSAELRDESDESA
jgi:hypothetical protein